MRVADDGSLTCVTKPPSILRILLALFICGGLCGLEWIRFNDVPDQPDSRERLVQEAVYGANVLLASIVSDDSTASEHSLVAKPAGNASFAVEPLKPFEVAPPALILESRLSLNHSSAQSASNGCRKNKDPPFHTAGSRVSHSSL